MKYQSQIIKEIIAEKGHSKSLPHYESECVETWIEETKGAYPKLTDYKGEWLAYINDNNGIGEFPYVSLTDVTEASIENVVPYAYKSAILSGNTLVNLCDKTKRVFSADGNRNLWQNVLFNTNPTQLTVINYTDKPIKYTINNRTNDAWVSTNKVNPNSKLLVNCGTNNYLKDLYGAYGDGWSNTEEDRNILKDGVLVLEGDHTQEDIPYFEGMQSVKMPVLKTSNEDGTKSIILTVNEDVELGSVGEVKDELDLLTGKIIQRTDIRPYQESDESDSEVLTDMTNTRYKLAQEVVKTVDLTSINEQGESETLRPIEGTMHVSTSSQTLLPLLDMCVPVEATTQNLMSFANIVEEE